MRAAEPYQINVILPLTGNIAFVGTTQLQALKAVEAYVNRTGGIGGRQIAFVVADDQGDPKTALQLAQGLIAKNVPIILGPSSPQGCDAIAPLINPQSGPLFYCLANSGRPIPGGYEFLTLFPYEPQFAVTYRYFRERGLKNVAYIVSTDAGGQDAERAILSQAALPENKSIKIVAAEHFGPRDLSVAAQMSRIKAAKLHAYLVKLRNWPGVNGPYDFVANPQRGIGEKNIVMVRWDQAQNQAFAVSKLGGAPLAGK